MSRPCPLLATHPSPITDPIKAPCTAITPEVFKHWQTASVLRRYYAGQSLTASLLGSSNHETNRLDKGCVFNCIRQGVDPLVPIDVELQPFVRRRLEIVSGAVLAIDECMQLAKGP